MKCMFLSIKFWESCINIVTGWHITESCGMVLNDLCCSFYVSERFGIFTSQRLVLHLLFFCYSQPHIPHMRWCLLGSLSVRISFCLSSQSDPPAPACPLAAPLLLYLSLIMNYSELPTSKASGRMEKDVARSWTREKSWVVHGRAQITLPFTNSTD